MVSAACCVAPADDAGDVAGPAGAGAGGVASACRVAPADDAEDDAFGSAGTGAGAAGSSVATVGAGVAIAAACGCAPACELATDRGGPAAGLAAAESPVLTCRSSFSTRRTRFRIIASRWRISFWSWSRVGSLVWARASIKPSGALPNNASSVADPAPISPSRAPTAANHSRGEPVTAAYFDGGLLKESSLGCRQPIGSLSLHRPPRRITVRLSLPRRQADLLMATLVRPRNRASGDVILATQIDGAPQLVMRLQANSPRTVSLGGDGDCSGRGGNHDDCCCRNRMMTTEIVMATIAVARIVCQENEALARAETRGRSTSHIAAQSPSDTSEATTSMTRDRRDRNATRAASSECEGPSSSAWVGSWMSVMPQP